MNTEFITSTTVVQAVDFNTCAETARDIIARTRDCGLCGGEGILEEDGNVECHACNGSGRVHVYGPNVRELAKGFIIYAKRPRR